MMQTTHELYNHISDAAIVSCAYQRSTNVNINSAKLIYFSPTQTTRKILEGIIQGIQIVTVEHVDSTLPVAKMQKTVGMCDELAIIGSPVYGGRLLIPCAVLPELITRGILSRSEDYK